MKRKLISILLACILALGVTIPVLAGDPPETLEIGDKKVTESGHEATYLGVAADGKSQLWQADFGDLQYIPGTNTLIDCQWSFDGGKGEWYAEANIFASVVKETKITVWNEDAKLSWQPDVFVGTKKLASPKNPSLIAIDPINENYTGNTLKWEYTNGITRHLRIIEGMLIEYYTVSEVPAEDILIIPHTVKDLEFVWTRPSSAWDAENEPVDLTIDKNGELTLLASDIAEATLPVTIDPDTTFYSSSSDGRLGYDQSAVWSTTRTAASASYKDVSGSFLTITANRGGGVNYYIYRSFVYFDTSEIDDAATLTNAVLHLYLYTKSSPNYRDDDNAEVYIVEGMATYPHDPLVNADFNYTYYTFGTEYGYCDAGDDLAVGYSIINVDNPTALKTIVSKTGWTKLALIERQDKENSAPSSGEANTMNFYSYEKGVGYRPKLVVTYTVNAPAITADAATYVAQTTARLNSTVDDDGGEACDVRWGYGTTTQTAANFLLYDTVTAWDETGYNIGEHPYSDISSLVADTPYYYRVQIKNSDSTVTSTDEITFTTTAGVAVPTSFKSYPKTTSVGLTWIKSSGATDTHIRYSETGYPTAIGEGIECYLGSLSSYTQTGLTIGHTYYFSAWGKSGANYSGTYATVMATTGAAEGAAPEPGAPDTPTGFFQDPDPTQIENFPAYDMWNSIATNLNMPTETLWLIMILLGTGLIGYVFFLLSHNLMVTMVVVAVGISLGSLIGILPLWMMFLVIILGLGLLQFQSGRAQ